MGSWILIGTRDWETVKANGKPKCDLLEVYNNDTDIEKLKRSDIDWTPFASIVDANGQSKVENNIDVLFSNEKETTQKNQVIEPLDTTVHIIDDDVEIDMDEI